MCGSVFGCKGLRGSLFYVYVCAFLYLFSTLGSGFIKAKSDDAEVFAVEDKLSRVKFQLLIGT